MAPLGRSRNGAIGAIINISEKNGSGIAIGTLSPARVEVTQIYCGIVGLDNIKRVLEDCNELRGVAVDAPLIIENRDGARPCENALSKVYRSKWAGCHPSNKSRFPNASSVKLSKWLEAKGLDHLGSGPGWQIEVYPHPAIIELFGLPARLKYKKGSLEEKREGQVELAGHIRTLDRTSTLSLIVPDSLSPFLDPGHIRTLSGLDLKHNEDALDALICLYVAGLYSSGHEMMVFGDTRTGYIVVPG